MVVPAAALGRAPAVGVAIPLAQDDDVGRQDVLERLGFDVVDDAYGERIEPSGTDQRLGVLCLLANSLELCGALGRLLPGVKADSAVLARAVDAVAPAGDPRPRLVMSPRGVPLTQGRVAALANGPGAVILCGRFEGVDQRLIEGRGFEEVSIGDYVLSGGEIAAMVLLDACVRLLPGVMGKEASGSEESFEGGLLEYPHYTRPREWEGREIPETLLSGDQIGRAHV